MVEQVKKGIHTTKEYWAKQTKKKKIILAGSAAGIILFAIIVAVLFNLANVPYSVLYPGMSPEESAEVFAALQSRSVPVQRNAEGEVLVPKDQVGNAMLDMAALGYPKTTLPFDIFSNNAGFTTTEFEKKQYLLMNLQDRIERTLKQMNGVKNAVVTLNVPQESTYVWEEEKKKSTGSVSLSLLPGYTMAPEKVSAIKKLVASSVPQLLPEDVTIIDSETMKEMASSEDSKDSGLLGLERLGFEAEVEKKMEEKVLKVLSLGYGPEDLMVSATVVIDYDRMITENMQYVPETNGDGIKQKVDEKYAMDKNQAAKGVPGEENNTDIPVYVDQDGDGTLDYVDYSKNVDYLVSYIKQQIEKDYAQLKTASIAITVKDSNLTPQKKEALIETASKAANVAPENISVNNFIIDNGNAVPASGGAINKILQSKPFWIAGAVAVLALIITIILLLTRKKKVKEEETTEQEMPEIEIPKLDVSAMQKEVDEHRKALREQAKAFSSKDNAITDEVREFSQTNPEITAALIRAWLKEGE
ncbi:flagellar basal-body M-ring protein/flagellar hook-basal body protein fliF [Hydrogenoanaerobacterium saccharovorans]|uniref:Flagellar basal-body M-ring protein/flagellar hook-basal body protein (FliF) n=1 Tax=Hydrogenoanaerobacterium saccharovorans TaxID=474960 RepID=A0A1H7ZW96_9FIRM|nr:flagellar basal-body MS-ring/collar protein FliF [Hydrogenoanaerobacterium saccharovorans]RPF48386.1 flagellar basal-body M-ring protein/flagellar hook-basal body protein fliF [Hydrogenoanaerobacterium saccharovorans]SEM61769.1 flagellar basal-body M-ring protein/flagellar hook-basal body protein (fliF) [Hydrogenoanaerobacterium saccharovorans]